MPIPQKIIKFLDSGRIKYEPIKHRTVYTAYDKAATLGVPQKIIGKTLVVKLNGSFGLVLIPANKKLDKGKFKKIVNAGLKKRGEKLVKAISFATEAWMKKNLKGVKVGAIPPFASLWKLPLFVDSQLLKNPKIILNAGDYNWSIKLTSASLKKLVPDLVGGSFTSSR